MEEMKTKIAAMLSIIITGAYEFLGWIGVNVMTKTDFDIFLVKIGRIVAIAAGLASVINYIIEWGRRNRNGKI